jgi:hypothetical protein
LASLSAWLCRGATRNRGQHVINPSAAVSASAQQARLASRTSPFGRQPLPTLCAPAKVIDENSAVVAGI